LIKKILIISFLFSSIIFCQDTTKSQVLKNNRPRSLYPLVKPKQAPYPLLAGYLLRKEADKGDPFAEHELGIRYLLGIGFPKDTVQAVNWIGKAANKGLSSAQFNYAIMLGEGVGTEWNPFEAFKQFKNAAHAGMPEAQYAYGIQFTDNFVVNKNLSTAYKWVKESSKNNYKPAEETLKRLEEMGVVPNDVDSLVNGELIPINTQPQSTLLLSDDKQLDFFEFAIDTLSPNQSDKNINDLLDKDKEKLKMHLSLNNGKSLESLKDTSGLGLLLYAADNGSPEALLLLGRMYTSGIGVEQDSIKAAENYIRAYRLGGFKAAELLVKMINDAGFYDKLKNGVDENKARPMYVWSSLSALGLDFSITYDQVFEFMKKSSDLDFLPAKIELGLAYYNGEIVEKDIQKAKEYWLLAMKSGSTEAKVRLALLNVTNSDDNEIQKEAVKTLKEFSNNGSVLAQGYLGYCYETGSGIVQNKSKAVRLYRQAMYRGNEAAFNRLKKMYDDIRPIEEEFQIYEDK